MTGTRKPSVTNLRGHRPTTATHGGMIIAWLANDGDQVHPGQLIVRFHPASENV